MGEGEVGDSALVVGGIDAGRNYTSLVRYSAYIGR